MSRSRFFEASASMVMYVSLAAAQKPTVQIVTAANAFLSTLDGTQRKSVLFSFDAEQQRKRLSNFPIAMVTSGGDASLHVHTMYRDATNDFGRTPAAK